MGDVKWTTEQLQAIKENGSNILVAAAAGSGKTAVLVERIIQKVMKEEIDIDRILVVTFTNAAASEMRQRILDAIYKKLEEEPDNIHLQKQILLLPKSNICTMHSFCLEVIRNHFYELDITPNFKIGDTSELEILKYEVLEEIFERKYENQESEFLNLINIYTGYRGDEPLKEIILKLYKYIQSSPFPKIWIEEKVEMFNLNKHHKKDFSDTIWGEILIQEIKEEVYLFIYQLKKIEKELKKYDDLEKFAKIISIDIQNMQKVYKLKKWDELYQNMQEISFERWPQDKKVTNILKEEAKEKRDEVKKRWNKIKEKIMFCDSKQANLDISEMYTILKQLNNLVIEFMNEYTKAKKEKNIIDFNDIEHYALSILVKDDEGEYKTTEISEKYRKKFMEIAVDEYQDSNLVQEYILNAISKGNNLFMVGDVKQSIYRFRQARPELFLEKYNSYSLKEDKNLGENVKIQLFKNFRSRKNILDITNMIFENIMSKEIGEIEYNREEYLNLGADFPEKELKTELSIIDLKEKEEIEEEEERVENVVLEAKLVAKKIQELIKSGYLVYDSKKKDYRKITYKDIVILLRSTNNVAPVYEKAISDLEIPVFSDSSNQYLETIEIQTIMSVLKIIDNPMQDIPLVTVLRSIIGGFDDNELLIIGSNRKKETYYESLIKYSEKENANDLLKNKIREFLKKVEKWREQQEYLPLEELIWQIYLDTGYYNYVSLMPNGSIRQANLKMLFEKAKQYESSSFKGLFNFIGFIDKLKLSSGDLGSAKLIGEKENVVRIMSIHKSKGLEFPVVFLSSTAKKFNMQDLNELILLHQDLGFGPKYRNADLKIEYPTLAKEAVKQKVKIETISEEMRILYVALTRAKEQLIITGISKDIEKELNKKREMLSVFTENTENTKISQLIIKQANSYLDWLEYVFLFNEKKTEKVLNLNIINKQEIMQKLDKEQEEQESLYKKMKEMKKDTNKENLRKILQWKYNYTKSSRYSIQNICYKNKRNIRR